MILIVAGGIIGVIAGLILMINLKKEKINKLREQIN